MAGAVENAFKAWPLLFAGARVLASSRLAVSSSSSSGAISSTGSGNFDYEVSKNKYATKVEVDNIRTMCTCWAVTGCNSNLLPWSSQLFGRWSANQSGRVRRSVHSVATSFSEGIAAICNTGGCTYFEKKHTHSQNPSIIVSNGCTLHAQKATCLFNRVRTLLCPCTLTPVWWAK